MSTCYTYLIGWPSHKTYYYGVRYSKKCDPSELWKTYFTSSKYVRKFRMIHGEPDIIQVRKTFTDSKSARQWEYNVIRRMKIVESDQWLNRSNRGEYFHVSSHTEKTKKRISQTTMGRSYGPMSDEQKRKISDSQKGEKSVHWGKTLSFEHREKIRQKLIGTSKPGLFGEDNPFFGKRHSQETKNKLSSVMTSPQKQTECPHCGKRGHSNIMKRWHFDNCRVIVDQISKELPEPGVYSSN